MEKALALPSKIRKERMKHGKDSPLGVRGLAMNAHGRSIFGCNAVIFYSRKPKLR